MIYGFRTHRLEELPYGKKELKLSQKFHEMPLEDWDNIASSTKDGMTPDFCLTKKERNIVATVIQWLGTPVGESFLESSDFISQENIKKILELKDLTFKRMSIFEFIKWRKNGRY